MISSDLFRQVMSNFASGVTIVTTFDDQRRPYGLTVSAFTSVSLDPVQVLVCLANRLTGLQLFVNSKKFGVSILSESQEDLSRMFARKDSERPPDIYFEGRLGLPLLRNALATLECVTVATYAFSSARLRPPRFLKLRKGSSHCCISGESISACRKAGGEATD
jgi:flavin reductase ActVB